ncbi:MAG: glycosyltransferase family 39 protein [Thermoguttaceae bacterium]|nr:glycosyltransferase family 39 protein [Thermoguttaceae bacterium]
MNTPISKKFFLTTLAIFLLGRLLLMWFIPLAEPSEARYAVMCKNMAKSGNFLEPKFIYRGEFQCFEGKPALPFQMGGLCCLIFGSTPFATRVPSFLAMCLILWGTYSIVKKHRDVHTAYTAVLLTLCSLVFYMFGGVMMTDMVLTAAIVMAIYSYIEFEHELAIRNEQLAIDASSTRSTAYCLLPTAYSLLFFFSLGVGMAAKGPVAIVMAGLPVFFFVLINNRWKNLKYHSWILGTIVFLIPCLPWYILMQMKNQDFLYYFFITENVERFLHPDKAARYGTVRDSFYGMSIIWFILANIPLIFSLPMFYRPRIKAFYNLVKGAKSYFSDSLTGMAALTVITIPAFWCLTSQSLLPYLIPTTPLLAIFLAVRFNDIGELSSPGRCLATKLFILFCAIGFTLGPAIVTVAVRDTHPNLNTEIYHKLNDLKQQEEWKQTPLYFMGAEPYSAEFYLDGQLRNHDRESMEESLNNSSDCLLVASVWNEKKLGKPINRKLLFRCQAWNVYAPEEDRDSRQ